jgi:hypothetical protein
MPTDIKNRLKYLFGFKKKYLYEELKNQLIDYCESKKDLDN